MKKTLAVLLSCAMAASLAACGGSGASTAQTTAAAAADSKNEAAPASSGSGSYTLKVNTALSETDPLFVALTEVFEKNVEEKTNGDVQIEVYSGSQLGNDEDVLEQAIVGAGVGVITDPGRLSNYVYDIGVLQAPYIAESYDEALKLFETETYKGMEKEVENCGFQILSFNYYQGERELFTKNPVKSPADLKGQRIRSSGSQVVTSTLEAMGANTSVLAWSEAYQALQQQVIEGVEVHLSAAVGSSMQEVTKYLAFTGHQQLLTGLVISQSWYSKLPEEYQTILKEASFEAGKTASENVIAKNDEYLKTLTDGGIEVVECDKEAFKTACDKVYEEMKYSEVKAAIDAELGR
ncbi:MAG: C4-dicarboxylate TRAP transporter substrate-binding protein [Lachnospiraceae bacterium]|nr:C4-dicarboxylate TRAP transporter substrate-binding protein [Lachnospiraceae bacterium]